MASLDEHEQQVLGLLRRVAAPLVRHFQVDRLILLTLLLTIASAIGVAILNFRPLASHTTLQVEPEG